MSDDRSTIGKGFYLGFGAFFGLIAAGITLVIGTFLLCAGCGAVTTYLAGRNAPTKAERDDFEQKKLDGLRGGQRLDPPRQPGAPRPPTDEEKATKEWLEGKPRFVPREEQPMEKIEKRMADYRRLEEAKRAREEKNKPPPPVDPQEEERAAERARQRAREKQKELEAQSREKHSAEAGRKLKYAKQELADADDITKRISGEDERLKALARKHLQDIVDKFPDTAESAEAQALLKGLK